MTENEQTKKPEPERYPWLTIRLRHIDQAAKGLNGIGMTLSALLIGGDYEEEGDRLIDNYLLMSSLFSGIEALSWLILSTAGKIEEIADRISVIEKQA